MPIIEPAIRPPAEAYSFLLQVTLGCSANACTFCGAYLNKPFRIKSQKEIFEDIEHEARINPEARKVFLMDGDALALNNQQLVPILIRLNEAFPHLTRISSYANGYNIMGRSDDELKELYEYKFRLIYIGLESGSQEILSMCNKKSTVEEMIEAVNRASNVNIKSSVIVLLGLGGKRYSKQHIIDTAKALNRMQPRFLSFLSLMLIPGTKLYQQAQNGKFIEADQQQLLEEAFSIIEQLELKQTVFRCNHASNYLPLEGRLPQDKMSLLQSLKGGIEGKVSLKPDFFRGL